MLRFKYPRARVSCKGGCWERNAARNVHMLRTFDCCFGWVWTLAGILYDGARKHLPTYRRVSHIAERKLLSVRLLYLLVVADSIEGDDQKCVLPYVVAERA